MISSSRFRLILVVIVILVVVTIVNMVLLDPITGADKVAKIGR